MKDAIPIVEPIKLKEYDSRQSNNEMVAKLPMRSVLLGPSGSGKTVLLVSMILDIYRDCFARKYIWSPSVFVDHSWEPVKKYIEKDLKINTEKEKTFFDEYNHSDLENVIDTQYKLIDHMKKQEYKKNI